MTNVNTPEEYREILKDSKKGSTIINIVASCSNVGKTTLIEGLIKELRKRGYSLSTIKHDVHGFDISETDFIIVEGYKKSNLRKIEVAREEKGRNIITPRDKLIAVASDFDPLIEGVEWVDINDYEKLADIVEKERYL